MLYKSVISPTPRVKCASLDIEKGFLIKVFSHMNSQTCVHRLECISPARWPESQQLVWLQPQTQTFHAITAKQNLEWKPGFEANLVTQDWLELNLICQLCH